MMTSLTCCFFIPAKAGMILLGVISLIGGFVNICFGTIIIGSETLCNESYNRTSCNEERAVAIWYGPTIIALGSIGVLVSILMFIGLSKRKPNLLLPYVAMMIVNLIANICVGSLLLAVSDVYGIRFICWGCIMCYFVHVVRLYRLLMIQQILADKGLITANPSGTIRPPGEMNHPKSLVVNVYDTQSGYTTQSIYNTQQAYPVPGSYPQPGYPQHSHPYQPQPQGIYPPQDSYPPPYPGNQPDKS